MTLTLQHQLVTNVQFQTNFSKGGSFSVRNNYRFRVDYLGDGTQCKATLEQRSVAKDGSEIFSLTVEMLGLFNCEELSTQEDKRQAHIRAYELLFPHMQAFIRGLTVQSGLAPLLVSPDPPKEEEVEFNS